LAEASTDTQVNDSQPSNTFDGLDDMTQKKKTWFSRYIIPILSSLMNLGPLGHAGVDLLGIQTIFKTAAIAGTLAALLLLLHVPATTIPALFVSFTFIVGFIAAIENWALEVHATKSMLNHYTGPTVDKSITDYRTAILQAEQIKDANKRRWKLFKLYVLRPFTIILPDFIFKVYFAIRAWYQQRNAKHQTASKKQSLENADDIPLSTYARWKKNLKEESWFSVLIKPFIRILGPLAAGAEYVMGLLALLAFFPAIYGLSFTIGVTTIPIVAVIACALIFFIAATQNYALNVNRALARTHDGLSRLWQAFKNLYLSNYRFIALARGPKHLKYQDSRSTEKILRVDELTQDSRSTKKILRVDELTEAEIQDYIKQGYRRLIKPTHQQAKDEKSSHKHWLFHANNHVCEIADTSIVIHKTDHDLYSKDALLQTLSWRSDAKTIWQAAHAHLSDDRSAVDSQDPSIPKQQHRHFLIHPDLLHDITLEEMTLIELGSNASRVFVRKKTFFEYWIPALFGPIILALGPAVAFGTATLGMFVLFQLFVPHLTIAGLLFSCLVGLVASMQHFCLEGEESINLLMAFGGWLDNYFRKIRHTSGFSDTLKQCFPNGLWFIVPDWLSKLGLTIYRFFSDKALESEHLKAIEKKGWLRVTIGWFVGIFGPIAHGAEAYRAILLGIFVGLGLTGILAFPTWMLVVGGIGFVVAMVQNRALEVKAVYERLEEADERLNLLFSKHKVPILLGAAMGLTFGGGIPAILYLVGPLASLSLAWAVSLIVTGAILGLLIGGNIVMSRYNKSLKIKDTDTQDKTNIACFDDTNHPDHPEQLTAFNLHKQPSKQDTENSRSNGSPAPNKGVKSTFATC